jgi:hypothetical protein
MLQNGLLVMGVNENEKFLQHFQVQNQFIKKMRRVCAQSALNAEH